MKFLLYIFSIIIVFIGIGSLLANVHIGFFEYISGYITILSCIACIYFSCVTFKIYQKIWGFINISASVTMTLMYFLWLAFDYGSVNNALSSFGFNISETLRSLQVIYGMTNFYYFKTLKTK